METVNLTGARPLPPEDSPPIFALNDQERGKLLTDLIGALVNGAIAAISQTDPTGGWSVIAAAPLVVDYAGTRWLLVNVTMAKEQRLLVPGGSSKLRLAH